MYDIYVRTRKEKEKTSTIRFRFHFSGQSIPFSSAAGSRSRVSGVTHWICYTMVIMSMTQTESRAVYIHGWDPVGARLAIDVWFIGFEIPKSSVNFRSKTSSHRNSLAVSYLCEIRVRTAGGSLIIVLLIDSLSLKLFEHCIFVNYVVIVR